jgi:hypothetical protein
MTKEPSGASPLPYSSTFSSTVQRRAVAVDRDRLIRPFLLSSVRRRLHQIAAAAAKTPITHNPNAVTIGKRVVPLVRSVDCESLLSTPLSGLPDPTRARGEGLAGVCVLGVVTEAGTVAITGVIKTLRYAVSMPAGLLHWSTYLHDGATIFLIVLLALHVGALVLVPRNWPLLKSMFTTRVSRAYAKAHLPLWAEEEEAAEKR